jgi:hypothetical protein
MDSNSFMQTCKYNILSYEDPKLVKSVNSYFDFIYIMVLPLILLYIFENACVW